MDHALISLLQAYASLEPPRNIAYPQSLPVSQVHQFVLDYILLHPHLVSFPPSREYQRTFFKWLILQLETQIHAQDAEIELEQSIYDHYLALLTRDPSLASSTLEGGLIRPPDPSFLTYFWYPAHGSGLEWITLKESRATIQEGTTGLRTWPASLKLANYLIDHPELVSGTRTLELGCGIGLVGSLVAMIQTQTGGIQPIYLSDINQSVLDNCKSNCELICNASSTHPKIQCVWLDWLDAIDNAETLLPSQLKEFQAQLILGADIVYDPSLIPGLVATLKVALTVPDSQALISLTIRSDKTHQAFLSELTNARLEVKILPHEAATQHLPHGGTMEYHNIQLYNITLRR